MDMYTCMHMGMYVYMYAHGHKYAKKLVLLVPQASSEAFSMNDFGPLLFPDRFELHASPAAD